MLADAEARGDKKRFSEEKQKSVNYKEVYSSLDKLKNARQIHQSHESEYNIISNDYKPIQTNIT